MVNAVSIKMPLILGTCVAVIAASLGLYLALSRSEDDPALDTKTKVTRSAIAVGVGAVIGLIAGSMVHSLMFSIANPGIAATNYALGQTRSAIFGQ
jgi:hypothetical protein